MSLGSILSALTSCGTETGNPVIKRPTTPRNVAQDAVESEFLDLTESLGESDSSTTGLALVESISNDSFSLAGGKLVDSTVNQPSCSADSTKASFVTQRKNEIKKNFKREDIRLRSRMNAQSELTGLLQMEAFLALMDVLKSLSDSLKERWRSEPEISDVRSADSRAGNNKRSGLFKRIL